MVSRGLAALAILLLAACGEEMARQPGTAMGEPADVAAPIPPGTVPRGALAREAELATTEPVALDLATLERGRTGFEAFCSPCHGRTGRGDGMVVRHGFPPPPSLHAERLRAVPPAYVVQVITSGLGRMPSYADQIEPDERWAIAAYVKALQLSQAPEMAAVPQAEPAAALPEPAR